MQALGKGRLLERGCLYFLGVNSLFRKEVMRTITSSGHINSRSNCVS